MLLYCFVKIFLLNLQTTIVAILRMSSNSSDDPRHVVPQLVYHKKFDDPSKFGHVNEGIVGDADVTIRAINGHSPADYYGDIRQASVSALPI
jgi:hypothetical protein